MADGLKATPAKPLRNNYQSMESATRPIAILNQLRTSSRATASECPHPDTKIHRSHTGHKVHKQVPEMLDPSATPGARDAVSHITAVNPNHDSTQKIIKDLLDPVIKPALQQQYLSLKKIATQKMLSELNALTTNQESIYEGLRQDNLWLNNQVQDLT